MCVAGEEQGWARTRTRACVLRLPLPKGVPASACGHAAGHRTWAAFLHGLFFARLAASFTPFGSKTPAKASEMPSGAVRPALLL